MQVVLPVVFLVLAHALPQAVSGQGIDWTRQFGTAFIDYVQGTISADASGVYVFGLTTGALPDQTSSGSYDVFVRKYNAAGTEAWTRQFGSPETDYSNGLSWPPARSRHAMASDSQSDRIVIFGGNTGVHIDETWAYDFEANTWANRSPATNPSARSEHAMAYDSQSNRIVLFGGWTGGGGDRNDETWTYDFEANTWTKMSPIIAPAARYGHAMAYDSQSDRILLFGGRVAATGNNNDETWAYDFETNTWTNMNPTPKPSARSMHALAYDSGSDRSLLFGGWSGENSDETWAYNFEMNTWTERELSPIPPSDPRNLQAVAGNALVTLTWQAPASDGGSPISNYRVYRGTTSGGETLLTTVGNVLTYTDSGLTNGQTYYYQVSAVNGVAEGTKSNEVSATPTAPTDSIRPVIAIGSPANNSALTSTTVTVTGTASDNVAVEKVELSRDGATWTLASGTTSWSGSLTLQAGTNVIYARATDTSGNPVTVRITVTVQIPGAGAPGLDPILVTGILVALAIAILVVVSAAVVRSRRRRMTWFPSPPSSPPTR